MATIEITIPDAKLSMALDAIANQTGWDPEGSTTKAQHARQWLWLQVKGMVRKDLINTAYDAGMVTVNDEMDTW